VLKNQFLNVWLFIQFAYVKRALSFCS